MDGRGKTEGYRKALGVGRGSNNGILHFDSLSRQVLPMGSRMPARVGIEGVGSGERRRSRQCSSRVTYLGGGSSGELETTGVIEAEIFDALG